MVVNNSPTKDLAQSPVKKQVLPHLKHNQSPPLSPRIEAVSGKKEPLSNKSTKVNSMNELNFADIIKHPPANLEFYTVSHKAAANNSFFPRKVSQHQRTSKHSGRIIEDDDPIPMITSLPNKIDPPTNYGSPSTGQLPKIKTKHSEQQKGNQGSASLESLSARSPI